MTKTTMTEQFDYLILGFEFYLKFEIGGLLLCQNQYRFSMI